MRFRVALLAVVGTALAVAFAQTIESHAAPAPRPMQPDYLREMPTVERVKAEVRSRDRMDTAARQMGAFWQLRRIIETLAGPRLYRSTTPDERRLIGEYSIAYSTITRTVEKSLSQKDRPAWFDLHTRYELDRAFREELLTRFFSQNFRDRFRQAEAQELARARARADQQRAQSRPAAPVAQSSGRVGSFILLGLVALVGLFVVRGWRARRRLDADVEFAAHLLVGEKNSEAKQYAKAIESFKKSIAARPSSRAYRNLGDAYFALERYDDAAGAYEQAVRLEPDNVVAHFGLGHAHSQLKNFEKAIPAFQEAVRIKPDFTSAWFMLGVSHYAVGHRPDAETSLQRAIGSASKEERFPELYTLLGDVYLTGGKAEDALELCGPLGAINATAATKLETQARMLQANQHYDAKEYAKAIESCRKVIALRPESETLVRAYKLLGLTLHQAGQYDDSIVALKEARRLQPNDQEIHFGLGWTYVEAELYAEALPELQEAVRLKPDDSESHYWIGEAHKGLGELEKAIAAYREAFRLKAEARTQNQIGLALTGLEDFSKAKASFNEAIRLSPDTALYHSNLGLLYVRMGDTANALRVLKTLETMDAVKATALRDAIVA